MNNKMYTNLETALCPIHYRCLTLLIAPTSASWWGVGTTSPTPPARRRRAASDRHARGQQPLLAVRHPPPYPHDPAITAWLLAVYFSDMSRCLGPRLCVAYLTSPDLHQAIREAPGSVGAYEDRSFAVAFFGDEGAAVTWLHAQQRSQDMVAAPPLGEAR